MYIEVLLLLEFLFLLVLGAVAVVVIDVTAGLTSAQRGIHVDLHAGVGFDRGCPRLAYVVIPTKENLDCKKFLVEYIHSSSELLCKPFAGVEFRDCFREGVNSPSLCTEDCGVTAYGP